MYTTLTSYAPVNLATKGTPFMVLTDLRNQPIFRKSLRENPKL